MCIVNKKTNITNIFAQPGCLKAVLSVYVKSGDKTGIWRDLEIVVMKFWIDLV